MTLIKFMWACIAPIMLHADDDSGGGSEDSNTGGGTLLGDAAGAGDSGGDGGKDVSGDGTSGDPFFVGLWDNSGTINKDRFDALPEHLKGHKETFSKYKTADDFFNGMGNLAQLAGKKGLEPLPEDAPDSVKEERAALMRKLNNVPETADDYGITKPDDLPDEQWNGEYVKDVLSVLHKHSASPALVKELVAIDAQHATNLGAESQAAQEAAFKAESAKLTEAFGSEIQQKTDQAKRMARTLGLDPATDPMFRSASVVQAFANMFSMVSEDRLVSGDGGNNLGASDREKARDIVFNPGNPLYAAYHNTDDSRHKQALDQVEAFNKRASTRPTG